MGMEYRSTWRDQHATISRKLIEIDGLAKLHNLADLQVRIADTNYVVVALSTLINHTILEIEATHRMITAYPIKPPSHSGDMSEDLATFQDNFETTAVDNKAPGRDQMGEIWDRVTGEAITICPNGLRDIREAWLPPQEAFGNSHTNLHYSLSRIRRTPHGKASGDRPRIRRSLVPRLWKRSRRGPQPERSWNTT
jgi:hypothetical protein